LQLHKHIFCFVAFITASVACTKAIAQTATLNDYVDSALAKSPLLYDYQNQILLNTIDSLRIRAANKVQVTGSGNAMYPPTINGYGYDQAITNGGNFSALITANKSIISRRNLALQFDALRFVSDSLRINSRLTQLDISRSIAIQYITAYGTLLVLQFNEEIADLLRKEDVLLRKLTEKSVYRQTDYLTFVVTMKQQEIAVQQARSQYKTDLYTLNYLAGITDTSFHFLQEPQLNVLEKEDVRKSVFFQQYRNDSLRLANNKALIDFSYKPRVGVYTDGGFNSTLIGPAYKHFGVSFGVNLTVPIYDGHQKKLLYQRLDIEQRTREKYRQFQLAQYGQQTAQLRLQLTETDSLIRNINSQLKYSEGLVAVNRKLMQTGDARITDYVLSLNSYLSAKNQLTLNTINRMQLLNQINYWNH
jgi:outer membrane protein TolC